MRSKAPLSVIEQLIMLVVFSLAAAVCLRGFAWADSQSKHSRARDLALIQAQSAAGMLKQTGGDLAAAAEGMGGQVRESQWTISYDEDWEPVRGEGAYVLSARHLPQTEGLPMGSARVTVQDEHGTLSELCVSWQEVDEHAE